MVSACGFGRSSGETDSCFKIQFAGVGSFVPENPSNRSKTIRKESRKNFLAPLGVSLGDFLEEEVRKRCQLNDVTCWMQLGAVAGWRREGAMRRDEGIK
jgi:hypothetical protein